MTDAPPPDPITMLRRVRQMRDFRPDPVPDEAVREILDVARWTGSAMNRQPWHFVVVRDREALARLAEASPNAGHVGRAPLVILVVMPGEQREMDAFDEARVAERIMTAASALGLAAAIGWIVAPARGLARELFGVPEGRLLRTAVSIGYPSGAALEPKSAPGSARRPLEELVSYERMGGGTAS